jgi:hypothetical protein
MARTKREIARLAGVAARGSLFRVNPTTVALYCPVDVEMKRAAWDTGIAHTFRVEGLGWDARPKRADIIAALECHLDPGWEDLACPHVQGSAGED